MSTDLLGPDGIEGWFLTLDDAERASIVARVRHPGLVVAKVSDAHVISGGPDEPVER